MRKFVEEQLVYFPNAKRILDMWIIIAGELFDSIIIHDEIAISDMPPVQQTAMFDDIESASQVNRRQMKANVIDAA